MEKISIKKLVTGMLELKDQGDISTLLGIGPMSLNLIKATLELARDEDFPVMFIASRNQVDAEEFGCGYVNGWDQFTFADDIKRIADQVSFDGQYYLCRDHGGPWQRDEERNAHLEVEEAMHNAKQSYVADIEAGFDLLMIDPTKDPFEIGKVIPMDTVLDLTVELIEFCEKVRLDRNLPEIGYEVGTEETNGGLTTTDKYESFINQLSEMLTDKGLPMPTFIVGQTGTLTRKTEQIGKFNYHNGLELSNMASKYGVGLKEHNGDYLDDVTLLMHSPAKITATNIAPQYGTQETRAYLNLAKVEEQLLDLGTISSKSNIASVLLDLSIKSERWRKWMVGEDTDLTVEDILDDDVLSAEVLDIAGHYTFNEPAIKNELDVLYKNLEKANIDGERYVINYIKRPIRDYVEAYNLKGLTTKIARL